MADERRIDQLEDRVALATDFLPSTPTGGPSGRSTILQVITAGLNIGASPDGSLLTLTAGTQTWVTRADVVMDGLPEFHAAGQFLVTKSDLTGFEWLDTVPIAHGGTGATDAAGVRANLGLGSMALQAGSAVAITGGSISGITDLAVADGGTGASDAAGARANLGLVIGTNIQAYDADLQAIAGLAGNSGFLKKTGANSWDLDTSAYLTGNQLIGLSGDVSGSGTTSISVTLNTVPIAKGGTGATTAQAALNALVGAVTSGNYLRGNGTNVVLSTLQAADLTGVLTFAQGGTSASDPVTARNNLLPSQTSKAGMYLASDGTNTFWNTVVPSGIGILPVANGGTNAADAPTARTNLGLGSIATQAASSVTITGGSITGITDLAVADGGTGTSTGSITGTTALVFTAGGTAQPVTLAPSTTGPVNLLSSTLNLGLNTGANITVTPTARVGTGAGASIVFQPGAQVTSGGDGKIIFKAAASGSTQNFAEFQTFSNYTNAKIDSAGNFWTDSGITFGTDATTKGGPFYILVAGSGTGTPATGGTSFGRDLIVQAGASDNAALKEGGDLFLRGGNPTAPATVYGDVYMADLGGSVSIGSTARVGKLYVISSAITQKTAVLRSMAGQTANIFEQQNSAGVVQTQISSAGWLSNNVGIRLGIDPAESGPYTIEAVGSGGATPAPAGTGFGRDLIVKGGDCDNTAGKTSGNLYLRAGTPVSPSVTYGNVYLADNGGSVSIGSTSLVSKLFVLSATTTQKTIVARIASGQTVPAIEVQNNAGSALMAILAGGGIQPASMANASAPNNSIYYSTDASKLVYKDPGGVVNNLY